MIMNKNKTYITAVDAANEHFQWFMILDHEKKQAWLMWPKDECIFRPYHYNYAGWMERYGKGGLVRRLDASLHTFCRFSKELRKRRPDAKLPP